MDEEDVVFKTMHIGLKEARQLTLLEIQNVASRAHPNLPWLSRWLVCGLVEPASTHLKRHQIQCHRLGCLEGLRKTISGICCQFRLKDAICNSWKFLNFPYCLLFMCFGNTWKGLNKIHTTREISQFYTRIVKWRTYHRDIKWSANTSANVAYYVGSGCIIWPENIEHRANCQH